MRLTAEPRPAMSGKTGGAAPQKARLVRRRPWLRRLRRIALYGSLGGGALALLAGGGFWLYRTAPGVAAFVAAEERLLAWSAAQGLVVNDIEVEGRERTGREALLEAIGAGRGTPILSVDPARLKERIELLPWVRSASVERRLPDTLYVRITERTPLALWQRQGRLLLVDHDGKVVPVESISAFPGLIVLVGDDAPPLGAGLLAMLATEPEIARRVNAAVRVGGRRWNLRLDNGIDVELPEDHPDAAWRQLAKYERSDGLLQRDIQTVDLRLPDRLVLKVAPEAIPKPPPKKTRQGGKTT